MGLFKSKGKQKVADLLSATKALTEIIIDNFKELLSNNCLIYRKKDGKPKRAFKPKERFRTIENQQDRLIEQKMRLAYANLGIFKLPKNWKHTNQYNIFLRSNLVQLEGYANAMLKNLKPKAYVTSTGLEKLVDIGLDKQFLVDKVEETKIEIEAIDKLLTSFNTTTNVENGEEV
jgi:hypothetical protein